MGSPTLERAPLLDFGFEENNLEIRLQLNFNYMTEVRFHHTTGSRFHGSHTRVVLAFPPKLRGCLVPISEHQSDENGSLLCTSMYLVHGSQLGSGKSHF